MNSERKLAIKIAKINAKKIKETGLGLWGIGELSYGTMDAYSVGMDYLKKFFEAVYGTANGMSMRAKYIETLKSSLGSKFGRPIESLGESIKLAEMSESDVQDSADVLASQSNGKVPSSFVDFRQALTDQAVQVKWISWDALKTVGGGIVSDVGDKVVKVGELVSDVAESAGESIGFVASINKYAPFILPVAVGVVVWKLGIFGAVKKKIASV